MIKTISLKECFGLVMSLILINVALNADPNPILEPFEDSTPDKLVVTHSKKSAKTKTEQQTIDSDEMALKELPEFDNEPAFQAITPAEMALLEGTNLPDQKISQRQAAVKKGKKGSAKKNKKSQKRK